MRRQTGAREMSRLAYGAIVGLGAVLAGMTGAGGQDLCVSCNGPAQTYRCQVDGPAGVAVGATDPRAQVLCITEIARQGGHETCSVDRSKSNACDGPIKVVTPPDEGLAAVPMTPVTGGAAADRGPAAGEARRETAAVPPPPALAPPKAAAVPAEGEPRTVEEMVDKSGVSPKTGLQKAGQTIAKTANSAGEAVSGTAKAAGEVVTGTAKSAGDAVGQAGSAVGGAAKKSWDCVTSLFTKC